MPRLLVIDDRDQTIEMCHRHLPQFDYVTRCGRKHPCQVCEERDKDCPYKCAHNAEEACDGWAGRCGLSSTEIRRMFAPALTLGLYVVEMELQFLFEVSVKLTAPPQRPEFLSEFIHHAISITRAIALARRLQSLVSLTNCFRPCAVSR